MSIYYYDDKGDYKTIFDEEGYDVYGYDVYGYGKDGFSIYNNFNKEGINKITGTKYDENGYDKYGYDEKRFDKYSIHEITGKKYDVNGYNIEGYNKKGYDIEGYNKKGYDIEGYNRKGFDKEGINKDTGTKFDKDGYDKDGYDEEGFSKEGINRKGQTREDKIENENVRRKNYLGLLNKAEKLGKGEMTLEEYIKTSKTSIDDLIIFAKKEKLAADVVRGLYSKKQAYKRYTKPFSKKAYIGHTVILVGDKEVMPTEQDVDKCIEYLKNQEVLVCDKTVRDTVRAYIKGEIDVTVENKSVLESKEHMLQELKQQEALTNKEMQTAKVLKEEYKEKLEKKQGKIL